MTNTSFAPVEQRRGEERQIALQRGVFTVSIDFELSWGTVDRSYRNRFRKLCDIERREVIDRLLQVLSEYRIGATWGIVGSLFLDPDSVGAGDGPAVHKDDHRLYYGPDLVERIRRCAVPQEIGSHTFSHLELSESRCPRATAERELTACVRVARDAGLELKSLIFPRNHAGHLGVAKELGFTSYRGQEPSWYRNASRPVRRIGHLWDIATAKTPPAVLPSDEGGIWNIPGSMLYTPSFGTRRCVPVWLRVLRAKRGLSAAVRQRRIFHLWFHPTDLVCRMDAMLDGLRRIFAEAASLRDSGQLDIRPMRELVPEGENS